MMAYIVPLLVAAVSVVTMQNTRNATEIVRTMDEKLKGKTSQAEITVQIIRPSWQRDLSMRVWTKGSDYSMVYITAPVREKGNVFLKRNKEVWNRVPAIEKTIKLPPSMMSQAWMGTDFTNDDLVKHSSVVTDYTHTLESEADVDGSKCYKIVMIPKPNASVVWGKIISYIDKKEYVQRRVEYYDEDNELINVLRGTNLKQFGGKVLASRIEMMPQGKPGHKTVMIYTSLQYDKPIDDKFFSTSNMEKVK